MTEDQSKLLKAAQDASAAMPVVQAFSYYYDMHGPDMADGLLAGLIAYKQQLDRNGVPIQ